MGCDIHICIEFKNNNQWHCAWHSDLYYSDWFQERFILSKGYKTYLDDPTGLKVIRQRNYLLFGLLSNVRTNNFLYSYTNITKNKNGIFQKPWPNDISPVLEKEKNDIDCHSHGYCSFAELINIKDQLKTLKINPRKRDACAQKDNAIEWITDIEKAIDTLFAPHPLIGHTIGSIPHNENYYNSDFDICTDSTGHRTLENYNRITNLNQKPTPENIRILICYDN